MHTSSTSNLIFLVIVDGRFNYLLEYIIQLV